MGRHVIHIPEDMLASGRKLTVGQLLSDFAERDGGGIRHLSVLPRPVTVITVAADDQTATRHRCCTIPALFRVLYGAPIIAAIYWGEVQLGPRALYTLNHALKTPAFRKGGLNIVQRFFSEIGAARPYLRGDWPDLLSFLEIRPVRRVKRAAIITVASLALSTTAASAAEPAIYYVPCKMRHKTGPGKRLNRRSRAQK